MLMDDLEVLSKIVWKRMEQRLDRRVNTLEQERYRFFLWLMMVMEEAIEHEYPPTGRIVRRFQVKKIGDWNAEVSTEGVINKKFSTMPAINADEFIGMAAEVVNFIETLDGFIIWNRFPKDQRTVVDDFQIIVDYSSKVKKEREKEKEKEQEEAEKK